jgi:hypothetical protein
MIKGNEDENELRNTKNTIPQGKERRQHVRARTSEREKRRRRRVRGRGSR